MVIVAEDGDLRYSILGKQETGEVKWVETRKRNRVTTTGLEEIEVNTTVSEAGMANTTVSEIEFKRKHSFNYNFFIISNNRSS